MKIVSRFHDYYDSARFYGHSGGKDSGAVYLREMKEISGVIVKDLPRLDVGGWDGMPEIEIKVVGFCGKIYYRWSYQPEAPHIPGVIEPPPKPPEVVFYSDDFLAVQKRILAHPKFVADHKRYATTVRDRWFRKVPLEERYRWEFRRINTELKPCEPALRRLFLKYGVPVFEIQHRKGPSLILNPKLADLQFGKVFPAPLAFQEIEMFLSSALVSEAQPPQVADNRIILEGKGFDNRWSFRHPVK